MCWGGDLAIWVSCKEAEEVRLWEGQWAAPVGPALAKKEGLEPTWTGWKGKTKFHFS